MDEQFRLAMAVEPHARLAYADWLEEQGRTDESMWAGELPQEAGYPG